MPRAPGRIANFDALAKDLERSSLVPGAKVNRAGSDTAELTAGHGGEHGDIGAAATVLVAEHLGQHAAHHLGSTLLGAAAPPVALVERLQKFPQFACQPRPYLTRSFSPPARGWVAQHRRPKMRRAQHPKDLDGLDRFCYTCANSDNLGNCPRGRMGTPLFAIKGCPDAHVVRFF